jgi:hypothetical protein
MFDEATVAAEQNEEHVVIAVIDDGSENIEDIAAMMTELEYTYNGCTEGSMEPAHSMDYLRFHRDVTHGQRGVAARGDTSKTQLSMIPRPEISGGCSQEDFKFFARKWAQYVRSFNEKDEHKLKDQLTNCPDETLRSALYKALGDRIDTLAMISAKQEREEPVRQFAARLCGLAAVCDLSVTCNCGLQVSEVEDTKQEVLSKVDKMTLAATITFIEARETGKTALRILGGKLTSG